MSSSIRKRLFAAACLLGGIVLLLTPKVVPGPFKVFGFIFHIVHFLSPGFILLGIIALPFPSVVMDPTLEDDDLSGQDLLNRIGPLAIFFPLLCVPTGSVLYWYVLAP